MPKMAPRILLGMSEMNSSEIARSETSGLALEKLEDAVPGRSVLDPNLCKRISFGPRIFDLSTFDTDQKSFLPLMFLQKSFNFGFSLFHHSFMARKKDTMFSTVRFWNPRQHLQVSESSPLQETF